MARPNKPLNAYPTEIRQMAQAAVSTPDLFPITIPFPNPTEAMAFRVLFYAYRRTLRSHIAHNEDRNLDPDPLLIIESQGAEFISSPRISAGDASTSAASAASANPKETYCVFQLASSQPAALHGTAALAKTFAEATSASTKSAFFEDELSSEPSEPAEPRSEPTLPDHIASRKTPPKSKPQAITLVIDNTTFVIPLADIDETHQAMKPEKLALLYANRLAAPAFPLATYAI